MLMKFGTLVLFILPYCTFGHSVVVPPDVTTTKSLQKQVEILSEQLERFNRLYLTALDQKMTLVVATVSALDANFKTLQERAHVWDIFRHHIDAWNDHMKSVDHKIDLLKRTADDSLSIESKLTSMEFTLNHILSKVDQVNDRNQEKIPVFEQKISELQKTVNNCDHNNLSERRDISNKLSNILRHILNIESNNCRLIRSSSPAALAQPVGMNTATILKDIEIKLGTLVENLSSEHMKESLVIEKQNAEVLEEILELSRNLDDRTLRMQDSQSEQGTKLEKYCKATSNELTTFTESADLLLKRIEKLVLSFQQDKGKSLSPQQNSSNSSSKTEENVRKEDTYKYDDKSTQSTSSELPQLTTLDYYDESRENMGFIQPTKTGCHDLTSQYPEGIYKFGESDINGDGRDFNERYCAFPTSGPGWTMIQRRGPYDEQENFNRSWIEYKNGFGNLTKDFWFGLEFMHRLTDDRNTYSLRIELEDFENENVWAEYKYFGISSEDNFYSLSVGGYSGNATDSLSYHAYVKFSTYDKNNDNTEHPCCPCAPGYGSGWWYDNCSEANLNGVYRSTPKGHDYIGIVWEKWHDDYSLKKTRMLVRPNQEELPEIPEDP